MKLMYLASDLANWVTISEKDILRRLKGFYATRRNTCLTKADKEKNKKRKLMSKANRRTYVSYKFELNV